MLVVLIIVGVLIAIIVPAVQRARESTRQAQCIHYQGQLAKAVHMHIAHEPYGRFPGYRAFASDGTTVVGWAPQVFDYLGKSDLPADPNAAKYLEILVCPSNQGPKDRPRLNYVVNGGQAGLDSPADGIFFDHAQDAKVFITKDDFGDGLTNTILLAENLDATEWTATDEASQCILWPLTAGNEVNSGTGARPSSHHPGGFVAAFADGSVKFMTESEINDDANVHTDQSTYVAMLTPGGNDTGTVSGGPGGGGSGGDDDDEPTGPCGLTGTYYEGDNWTGTSASRVDTTLHFPFGSGVFNGASVPYDIPLANWTNPNSPLPLWTASWVGRIKADYTETYTFKMTVDNTVWVYINGNEIGYWDPQTVPQLHIWVDTDPVQMTAGEWVDIEVRWREWANASGTAPTGTPSHLSVQWESPSTPQQEIPCENLRTD